jgi:protein-tyrosine phosphatase
MCSIAGETRKRIKLIANRNKSIFSLYGCRNIAERRCEMPQALEKRSTSHFYTRGIPLPVILGLLLIQPIAYIGAQTIQAVDPAHDHPAPATKLTRFQKIDHGVYKGSKPSNDADYLFLQSEHIKYIVDIRFLPLVDRLEVNKARKYGIVVIPVMMNASTFAPSEKHIRDILCLLSDERLLPVYFHCTIGRDRTALIATLYEIYFLGLSPERAYEEMRHFGFKQSWTLRGLRNYLDKHASFPWDDGKHTCKRFPLPSSQR